MSTEKGLIGIVSKLEFDLGLDSGDGIDELVVRSFGEKLRLRM